MLNTNMVNGAKLAQAIMSLAVTEEGRMFISEYGKYNKYGDVRSAKRFAKAAMKLNSLANRHGFGNFICKAIQSDAEVLQLASEVYDAVNSLVADACKDAYTTT